MPRVSPPKPGRAGRSMPRLVADRPKGWQLLLRRQRWLLRPQLLGVAGLGIVALVGFLRLAGGPGGSIVPLNERLGAMVNMRVRDIVVEGRANTPEPMLREALGIRPGQPILAFSVDAARQRIENLSWVQHAVVERRLPATIFVELTERRPYAIWQVQGKFLLIDREGQVVTSEDVGAFRGLPLVVGAGAAQHAAELLDALARQPGLQARVAASVRVGERRWNLHLSSGTEVLLPEGAERVALGRLAELQASQELLDRPLAVIDMRLPDRLVVRPQTAAEPDTHAPAPGPRRST